MHTICLSSRKYHCKYSNDTSGEILSKNRLWERLDGKRNKEGTIIGKFTKNVVYDKSVDIFDFGKKNDSNVINYALSINIVNSELANNFNTISISEEEFMK